MVVVGMAEDAASFVTAAVDYAAIRAHVSDLPWCALVTTGRAGSDFFQSLLDSHPEVFVFHGRLFFHTFWNEARSTGWGKSRITGHDGPLVAADIIDEFVGRNMEKFRTRYEPVERMDRLGDGRDQSIDIDIPSFKKHALGLLENGPVTSRTMLVAVYVAYALCLGQDVLRKRLFFHHIHHMRKLPDYLADIPESRIIAMTRDPRASYVAGVEEWRRYQAATDYPAHPVYMLKRTVADAQPLTAFPNEFRVMRLESAGDESVLHAVADWLGIAYHPCMTHSTWGGLRWWGDQLADPPPPEEAGYSPTVSEVGWRERLCRIDRFLFDYLLEDRLDWYGYPREQHKRGARAIFAALAILIPNTYERDYLAAGLLWSHLRHGRLRLLAASPWHYIRRVAFCYRLLGRRLTGQRFDLPYFRPTTGEHA